MTFPVQSLEKNNFLDENKGIQLEGGTRIVGKRDRMRDGRRVTENCTLYQRSQCRK